MAVTGCDAEVAPAIACTPAWLPAAAGSLDACVVLDVCVALDAVLCVAAVLPVVTAVCAACDLLAVLSAGVTATLAVPDFVVPADEVAVLVAVGLSVAVGVLLAVVVAVPLLDSSGFDVVLALLVEVAVAVAESLPLADADGSGLGEGSALGLADRDALMPGDPVSDDGSAVESPALGEVLLGVPLLAALLAGALVLLEGVVVGVAVLVGVLEVEPPDVELFEGVLVGVLEGLPVVGVGVGLLLMVGVGDGVGLLVALSGSHCWLVPLTAAAVRADAPDALDWAGDAATVNPAAAATRTPPVTRLTPTGRTCAKRMKALPVLFVAAAERLIQYGMAASGLNARLVRYAHHCTPSSGPGATVSTTQ